MRELARIAWSYIDPPSWSRRRAWGLVCAALAAVPGVRRHVLNTTALKDHPMFYVVSGARRKEGSTDA